MVSDGGKEIQEFLHFVQEDRAQWVENALGLEHLKRIDDFVGQAPVFSTPIVILTFVKDPCRLRYLIAFRAFVSDQSVPTLPSYPHFLRPIPAKSSNTRIL